MADIGMETEAVEIFMAKEDGKMGQADGVQGISAAQSSMCTE